MINTQPIFSQFHLPSISAGTNHHYASNKKQQQILHKHSQSLDANGPYIAISECHSGKSFMQKQQQPKSTSGQPISSCSLGQDRSTPTNQPSTLNFKQLSLNSTGSFKGSPATNPSNSIEQPSIFNNKQQHQQQQQQITDNRLNCGSKVFLHARSSSNIVFGSNKQYGSKSSNHLHHHDLNSSSTIRSSLTGSKYCVPGDKLTNRHFKIYEKNELANSTSLIDVSFSRCLSTSKCDCNSNTNFVNAKFCNFGSNFFINNCNSNCSSINQNTSSHLKHTHHNYPPRLISSTNRQLNAPTLDEKFDNLSINNLLSSNGSYLNCNQVSNLAPPRPPKPVKLRINNQITDQLNSSSTNNNSFNETFSYNGFILPSDEEFSPTGSKLYGSYKFSSPNSQSQHQRPPKNSLSSSCSSNASPFYNSNSNAQDSVFVYDQNQLNISNLQPFHHSPSISRLNSFEDTDSSENSPTYLNNSTLINLSISNQTSPRNYNHLCIPPAVNRNLKPRKNFNNQLSSSMNSNSSYYQPNSMMSGSSLIGDLEEEFYNNNLPQIDHCRKTINDSSIQYLDLDLTSIQDEDEVPCSQQSPFKDDFKDQFSSTISPNESREIKESQTVYKTVDFVKTNAFNKLRSNLERND